MPTRQPLAYTHARTHTYTCTLLLDLRSNSYFSRVYCILWNTSLHVAASKHLSQHVAEKKLVNTLIKIGIHQVIDVSMMVHKFWIIKKKQHNCFLKWVIFFKILKQWLARNF